MDKEINKIVDLILSSKNCIALTGAGVSTESGIPDFRSPDSGLWTKIDPMEVFSSWGFQANPRRFYEIGLSLLPKIMSAQPNAAHRLLALLEESYLRRSSHKISTDCTKKPARKMFWNYTEISKQENVKLVKKSIRFKKSSTEPL